MIVVNTEPWEIRVAHVENGRLNDLYVERSEGRSCVGNIYKGRVVRVLPGMQAAFVDIGLERTGFLYVAEVHDELNGMSENNGDLEEDATEDEWQVEKIRAAQIQDMLKEGQAVLVQVAKAPIGTKGARLTCHISLPGRSLVLMPTMNHIGISRRIGSSEERKRLRSIIRKAKRPGEGIIVRTASEGQTDESISDDIRYLHGLWEDIQKRGEKAKAPSLVYSELSLAIRSLRDLFRPEISKVFVDDPEVYDEMRDFMGRFIPKRKDIVTPYKGREPIFDYFGLESAINKTMERKVWLKSGGYIIIEQTEALVAIDVNTGRYTGSSKSFDETIFKTNLEAVNEIVYQLRFRNIGGIIILDFIDMDKAAHREQVYRALEEALRADKARTKISRITSLGLVEMTRKRTAEALGQRLTEPCDYCKGEGRIKSKESICYELFRALQREAMNVPGSHIHVNVHPEIARLLFTQEKKNLSAIEQRINKRVMITKDNSLHVEDFEIHP